MAISQKIDIRDTRFVDAEGRHVLLHGINLVNKNPDEGYFFDAGPELFAAMRDWGFNVIRLGVIWDGLEPEPGVVDEDVPRTARSAHRVGEGARPLRLPGYAPGLVQRPLLRRRAGMGDVDGWRTARRSRRCVERCVLHQPGGAGGAG